MIVPMKKIFLVSQQKDAEDALNQLQDIGALHIEHQNIPSGDKVIEAREDVSLIERVIEILKGRKNKAPLTNAEPEPYFIKDVVEKTDDIEAASERMTKRKALIAHWEPWGSFDPDDIIRLQTQGVYVYLVEISDKEKATLPEDVIIHSVSEEGGRLRLLIISQKEIELPYVALTLPEDSLSNILEHQKRDEQLIQTRNKELDEASAYLSYLLNRINRQRHQALFQEAISGMQNQDGLVVLKGYCPTESCEALSASAQRHHWGLLIEDPTDEDNVPTLLRNPKWVELSKPVFDMIEIIPGYKEFDVSIVFIVFFTLFFGMLIGDAAYGAIFLIGTLIAQIKLRNKVKDQKPFILMYLLTGFTIVWGVLTGTYFGQQWLPSTVGAVAPWLNDPQNVQWLCFTIAVVHLSIARLWAAAVKIPSLIALSEIGWLLIIWGMYFVANMFVLGRALPSFAVWLIGIGIFLALTFMVPFNKFFKTVPQEIIPFALGVIGAGTDIISYIRLFAVGLATVAVADAANAMPASLPGAGIVLMVFLHGLNMVLAAMAILVHALRLNVLEFSGHLNLEWAGVKYSPFKKV